MSTFSKDHVLGAWLGTNMPIACLNAYYPVLPWPQSALTSWLETPSSFIQCEYILQAPAWGSHHPKRWVERHGYDVPVPYMYPDCAHGLGKGPLRGARAICSLRGAHVLSYIAVDVAIAILLH